MSDSQCVAFLQWALPRLQMRWPGFRKVRKQVWKRVVRRLKELGLEDEAAYRAYLELNPSEWSVLDGFCRISISRFYRDRGVFDYLREEILPALGTSARRDGRGEVRCWSAGCASGEEAYTLAILWRFAVGPRLPGASLRVVATDSDPHMLDRARQACYSTSSLKDLPADWGAAAFTRSGALYQLKPEYREGIDFLRQDIRTETPPGVFELVLCRHLAFTYFEEGLQREVLDRLLHQLAPGGFLVTGKQEQMAVLPEELEECRARMGVYQKRQPADRLRKACGRGTMTGKAFRLRRQLVSGNFGNRIGKEQS
jgi:chemotaxis protein methyltransferase CheR